ncbi:MAG: precorrin-8X methylmutase [Caldimicrobium sp.]|nr:precorrin-8X methylmutase [Caldimicrobium sp.]MCX7613999.1 precorrin-8X methylmutase [Caldimicrobium sp.]MDW8182866.1 precorrin-8X methylmutase [Caldimicrobium sp.]
MEKIVLILHGSPRREANRWQPFLKILSRKLSKPVEDLTIAYLQFESPSLEEVLEKLISQGANKIIVHPFFLSNGHHVTHDIPKILDRYKVNNPEVEILYTKPLGVHESLADIVRERILEIGSLKGKEIEEKSFEIIEDEVDLGSFSPEEQVVLKRVIHATADFEFKDTMLFHGEAISRAVDLLRAGKDILVDVEMVRAGITKRYGKNRVLCFMSEVEEGEGTRAERAIELAFEIEENIGLVAIGNAPTALIRTIELINRDNRKDIVVVGLPVGFVRAYESKLMLSQQDFPFITNLSRKGGTPACVAVVNALLKLAHAIE